MFWCYIFLVMFYIACCCLDGNDLKPRWHRAVADILRKRQTIFLEYRQKSDMLLRTGWSLGVV